MNVKLLNMKNNTLKTILGIIVLIGIWQIISWLNILNPIYFASPIEVAKEFMTMFQNGSIFSDIWATLRRVLVALFTAAIVGIPIGLVLGYFKTSYKMFGNIIDFFRSIPPIILYPLFLIALGTGDSSRIAVAFIGGLVVIILIIAKGLFQQSNLRRDYVRSLGASKLQVMKDVVWHEALPHIFTSLRTASSLIIIIVIVTEMLVGAQYGLGTRVQSVQITSNIPDLFTTTIIIGILGVILNKVFIFLEKKYVSWKSN